jgi:hypothetical protein
MDSTGTHVGWEYTDVIKGDFNNDRREDYAALVRLGDPVSSKTGLVVVFFRTSRSFDLQVVDTLLYTTDIVLFLDRKGTTMEDFDTGKQFAIPADAIDVAVYEKCGHSYYYQNDRFHKFTSSD